MNFSSKTYRHLVLPLIIVSVATVIGVVIWSSKPDAKRKWTPDAPNLTVKIQTLEAEDIAVKIKSYGLVRPRTQSQLFAQVSGKVEYVSEAFRDGAFFKKGELLLSIEKEDYQIEVNVAEAAYFEAKALLEEQRALANQAELDWKRSGIKSPPTSLTLRKPQLASAEAKLKSAQARLQGAKLNLARTDINAPFDGRVLNKHVDVGQVISGNSVLGEVYAVDAVEIRLPLKNNELALVDLPRSNLGQIDASQAQVPVKIYSQLNSLDQWPAYLVRTEGEISNDTRQLHVVAKIDDPFGLNSEKQVAVDETLPLKINQYVTAQIEGRTVKNAIQIPNTSIYQGSFVYLYQEGVVNRVPIKILWQGDTNAIIQDGLNAGDQLVLTAMGSVNSGTRVNVEGMEPEQSSWQKNSAAKVDPANKKADGKRWQGGKP